jgi:nicotinamidase-related amidase
MNDFDAGVQTRSCSEALLILDMISDFEFEDGDKLYPQALAAAEKIAGLKQKAKAADAAVVYVNDNYGRWNEDFHTYTRNVREKSEKGRRIIELIEPESDDMFVLKPQRSGFYATPLGVLLLSMGTSRVVVAGVSTDICVLFTAHDAYMRGFSVCIPADCSAAVKPAHHRRALKFLERIADVDIRESDKVEFTGNKPAEEQKKGVPA